MNPSETASVPPDREPARIREMFTAIAPRYDRANRILSWGCDVYWRRVTARRLAPAPHQRALDLACGTGDLTRALAAGGGEVIGLDFTHAMLALARSRADGPPAAWVNGDALSLPFADGSFDRATVAFGVRNFINLDRALAEIRRVLRPQGLVGILEFSRPVGIMAPAATFYLRHVVPILGRLVSGRGGPYRYLAETIREWPDQAELAGQLENAGFRQVHWRSLTGGVAALHTGQR